MLKFIQLCELSLADILLTFPRPSKADSGRAFKMAGQQAAPIFNEVLKELGYTITKNNTVKKNGASVRGGRLTRDYSYLADSYDTLENNYHTDPIYYYNKYKNMVVGH